MRKALTITLVAALALFAGSAAYANYCARDVVPASTILVPWAVQAYDANGNLDFQGYTTILTITNVSKDAQIIHITVWSALSDACLDFNEVLSGFDMWQVFFRDMLNGDFGAFDTSRDPFGDTPSRVPFEWGPDGRSAYAPPTVAGLPKPDDRDLTPSTDCQMPYGTIDVSSNVTCLRTPLTARSHQGCNVIANSITSQAGQRNIRTKFVGKDWLANLGSNPLFFYVTVDVVNVCNFLFPSDTGYFATVAGQPTSGVYLNENVLIGDIVYVSAANNFSEAINAVHIESQVGANNSTFANFYKEKATTTDKPFVFTEPLATALAFDYYNTAQTTSSVIMWKNFHEIGTTVANTKVDDCGAYLYYTWDQDEHTISRAGSCQVSPCSVNDIDPNEFPFETQMVPITNDNFDLAGSAGWMLVIFPPSYGFTSAFDPTQPSASDPLFARPYMAWAGLKINYGSYSAGLDAATLANAHCFRAQVQPQLGVNYNYGFIPPATE